MKTHLLIPARIDSKRLPRKMLLAETGKALLKHTYERALDLPVSITPYVCSPDDEIIDYCVEHGIKFVRTGPSACGTHCCLLAAKKLGEGNVINVQGDCPNFSYDAVIAMLDIFDRMDDRTILSAYYETLNGEEIYITSTIKVVMNKYNDALYFSRAPIPYNFLNKEIAYNIHIGVYGFHYKCIDGLLDLYNGTYSALERTESLEQLLWLDMGYKIYMVKGNRSPSIDTREDYDKFIKLINKK